MSDDTAFYAGLLGLLVVPITGTYVYAKKAREEILEEIGEEIIEANAKLSKDQKQILFFLRPSESEEEEYQAL